MRRLIRVYIVCFTELRRLYTFYSNKTANYWQMTQNWHKNSKNNKKIYLIIFQAETWNIRMFWSKLQMLAYGWNNFRHHVIWADNKGPDQSARNVFTYEPQHDKTHKISVRSAKTQISLGIRPIWSEISLPAWRNLRSLATHWAHSEDSDQTGRMPRLIWVFAGRTLILLVLSCRGSYGMNMFLSWRNSVRTLVQHFIT